MVIGIMGKMRTGKDTVAQLLQYVIDHNKAGYSFKPNIVDYNSYRKHKHHLNAHFQIVKFADAVYQIISIITGIPVEELQTDEVKNRKLGKDWTSYSYATSFTTDHNGNKMMIATQCDEETYKLQRRTNWQTAYEHEYTVRELLQYVGTNLIRNQLLLNVWVNALFNKYKSKLTAKEPIDDLDWEPRYVYPNWIISDVRFPNELDKIINVQGITLRVNRKLCNRFPNIVTADDNDPLTTILRTDAELFNVIVHESETALDDRKADFEIDNDGSLEELLDKVIDLYQSLQNNDCFQRTS